MGYERGGSVDLPASTILQPLNHAATIARGAIFKGYAGCLLTITI